jgi:hypothetical protein
MPQTQRSQVQPVKLRCRFEMTAADAPSNHEFCVFEFPGVRGMPEGAAHCPDGGKFGRPHEVGGLARMDCARFPPKDGFSL